MRYRKLPGSLGVRTWHVHFQGPGSVPGQGNKILQAAWHSQKKKKKKKKSGSTTTHFGLEAILTSDEFIEI